MKKWITFIVSLLSLCIVAAASGLYAYSQYEDYQTTESKIAQLNAEKAIVIDNDVSFINTTNKFNFAEIESDYIWGYENIFVEG